MKQLLLFCSLGLISLSALAETCPQPERNYIFRVAAWGNHVDPTSQVRCHYYYRYNESIHYMYSTPVWYTEIDMAISWGAHGDRYNLCVTQYNNVNDCAFTRR